MSRHFFHISAFFLLAWFYVPGLVAQSWVVHSIGVQEGLASPDVWAIYQDQQMLLWVGTNAGVSAYDGQHISNYSQSIAGRRLGSVNVILEDAEGQLWIGSEQGLFYWQAGGFHHAIEEQLRVKTLAFGRDGTIWLGCIEGLYQWKPDTAQPTRLARQEEVFSDDVRIQSVKLKPNGELLIATRFYLCTYDGQRLKRIWGDEDEKVDIHSILVQDDDTFFWACDESTFYQSRAGQISPVILGLGFAMDLKKDHNQDLWLLCTDELYLFSQGQAKAILQELDHSEWLRCLWIDREENIWIGSSEGLLKIKRSAFQLYPQAPFPQEVYSISEDQNGTLLFGGNQGQLWMKEGDQCHPYLPHHPHIVPNAELFAICPNGDELWLGSGYQGIARYQEGQIERFRSQEGLADDSRYFFYQDRQGRRWTGGDGGIDQIIEQDGQTRFINYRQQTDALHYASFYAAVESPKNELWLGGSMGLFRLQADGVYPVSLQNYPTASLHITDMKQDKDGIVWMSTLGDGILAGRFHADGQLYFEQQLGLGKDRPKDIFLCLLIDQQEQLWAGSYQGIAKITPNSSGPTPKIRRYDQGDGFMAASFMNMCLYQARDGRIWGGTSAGLFSFQPDALAPNQVAPKMQIEGLLLLDGKLDWSAYASSIDSYTGLPQEVQLPYHINQFRISYSARSLRKPVDVWFRYRLEGLEEDWVYSQQERSASYHRLPAGSYRFVVQAANEDGLWSEQYARMVIDIRPAFWNSWWFRLLLLLTGIGLVYGIVRYRQKQRKMAAAEREAVAQRERERLSLQKKIAESKLTALQAQMNPHFVFNSLNSINWYIVKERPQEASMYLAKFSKLIRMILDHSNKLVFSLAKELQTLQLYLDLESMRFGEHFSYQIQTDAQIDPEEVMIPPLILQPFVENAIWHGLMHKKGKGELLIQIYPEQNYLKCIVQDNGIGRKAAAQLQSSQTGQHQSKGMKLTTDRINILRNDQSAAEMIRIIDLEDERGFAAGTRVEICLPYE